VLLKAAFDGKTYGKNTHERHRIFRNRLLAEAIRPTAACTCRSERVWRSR
jgi:hypothetical protein